MDNFFTLKNGQTYLTEGSADAYFVAEGTVLVYMVPYKNSKPGRRVLVCTAGQGHTLPGFLFTDKKFREWHFLFAAAGSAKLSVIRGGTTVPLKRRFSALCNVSGFEHEGFEQGLIDHYEKILAGEDAFFLKTDKEKDEVITQTDSLIDSFAGYYKHSDSNFEKKIRSGKTYRLFSENSSEWIRFIASRTGRKDIISFALMLLITILIGTVDLAIPVMAGKSFDELVPAGEVSEIFILCLGVILFYIGRLVLAVIRQIFGAASLKRIRERVQESIILKVFELPESFIRKYGSADLSLKILGFEKAAKELTESVIIALMSLLCFIIYTFLMAGLSLKLTVYTALIMIAISAADIAFSYRTQSYQTLAEEYTSQSASGLYQLIGGVDKIHMAGMEDRAVYEYLNSLAQNERLQIREGKMQGRRHFAKLISDGLIPVGIYAMIILSGMFMSTGNFIAYMLAAGLGLGAASAFSGSVSEIIKLQPLLDSLTPILKEKPECGGGNVIPGKPAGKVDVEHVSFTYDEGDDFALKDITIHVNPGEYIGIVGASGCGKSTLIKLLLGFEKTASGKIYYDGYDLETLDINELRRNFGVCLQDGRLIAGSILDNLKIAAPDADREKILKILDLVNIRKDIDKMPMGIHTVLNEGVDSISGGQKQRLLIARALLADPSVLFFDEATSALDNVTQEQVSEALSHMDNTRIVIAHRLSTVKKCDRIYVLDAGRIAECGDYDTLMARKGIFYEFASRQVL